MWQAAMLKAPRPAWTMLGDLTQLPTQKDAVTKEVEALFAFAFAHGCARLAFIASKTVVAMQAKRMATGVHVESKTAFVATRREALDWLASSTGPALR